MTDRVRIGYLMSRYPTLSETFILREVVGLRRLGIPVEVASVNDPDRPSDALTQEERLEAESCFVVKKQGAWGAIRALLSCAVRQPLRFLRAVALALRLGGSDLRRISYGFFYLLEATLVGEWMHRRGLRHLHVHFATPASTVGLLVRTLCPVTFSFTVHGPDEFYDAPGYSLSQKVAGADFVVCIGRYARSQLMKLSAPMHWNRLEVCPLGVDTSLFRPPPSRETFSHFEVVCVGRLVPAKGQHVLVAAIGRLVKAGRAVRLRLVGDGPDRASLEAEVAALGLRDAVVFEGAVNQDRIRDLYSRADAFALASFAEGIPVVLMEAMAMEVPCVTTFITGIPELIRPGQDGLLVAPSDDEELASALGQLMDDATFRRRIAEAGRLRVQDRYELSRSVERLAATFRRRLDLLHGSGACGESAEGQ